MQRFYYSETFQKFLSQSGEAILGHMDSLNEYDLTIEQRVAWVEELKTMSVRYRMCLFRDSFI